MNIAIIFAGGVGTRMSSKSKPKQFLQVHGKPIIAHTINAFENADVIDGIIVVMVKEGIKYTHQIIQENSFKKVTAVIQGGKTGQQSIYFGLQKAKEIYGDNCLVLIHDGVRPIIDTELIENNIFCAQKNGNAISGIKCIETVITLDDNNTCADVVDRSKAWHARAPQTFFLKDILKAHKKAIKDNLEFVDSCTMMYHYGAKLNIIECKRNNIKVTTREDYTLVRAYYDLLEDNQFLNDYIEDKRILVSLDLKEERYEKHSV